MRHSKSHRIGRPRALSPAQELEVLGHYRLGFSATAIAKLYGVTQVTISATIARLGEDTRPRRFFNDPDFAKRFDEAIRTRYPTEGTAPIARDFGVTTAVVSMRAWRLGVKCTTNYERKAETRRTNNKMVNQHFFDTWSHDMAYILGYIWADGAIRNGGPKDNMCILQLRCHEKDSHIIYDICRVMDSKHKISRYKPAPLRGGRYIGGWQVGTHMGSYLLIQGLIKRGIFPNKSNIDPPFPDVPDEYLADFVRGVFDGDGSIAPNGKYYTVVFYGSHRFIAGLHNAICNAIDISRNRVTGHGTSSKLSRFSWSSRKDLLTFMEWIYRHAGLCLKRKRDRFNEMAYGRIAKISTQTLDTVTISDGSPRAEEHC